MADNFTTDISVKHEYTNYITWSGETKGDHILTFTPKNAEEVVKVVNWAKENAYCVRPVGGSFNWSQLIIENGENNSKVLLLDLKKNFTSVSIEKRGDYGIVTAQPGITMLNLMTKLEKQKLGFYAVPGMGKMTLGGICAIGGHGTCLPAKGETLQQGGTYGSVCNSILALTAVVWNDEKKSYELKTFTRKDKEISAFLVHVGRALITEVTLQVPRNRRLRCQSFMNLTPEVLFANSDTSPNRYIDFLDKSGRAEVILFPFVDKAWLKVWTVTDSYPTTAKPVHQPFNYPFCDKIPSQVSDFVKSIFSNHQEVTPALCQKLNEIVQVGLGASISGDLWGWSKDLLLYVKPSTLRITANGYAIVTKRENIQKVLNEFYSKYKEMLTSYQNANSFPINCPIEIRVTGLDNAEETGIANAATASLSANRPDSLHPEWDVAIWLDVLTMPGTPDANKFMKELEAWLFEHYTGDYAVRVEWSKGWGYSETSAWGNDDFIKTNIPASLPDDEYGWRYALKTLSKYDPHHLFSSPLIKKIFQEK
ncbi:cholesterol oxidase substrate-binding domain-containing protein [Erwinia phyllosphaerae]|uniref:cholesterol oxidase substrate-binding domain-containing protein n=1 Tax=Erwinia phyllosphaerae TaxID=2853256 RepID=UPI001FEF9FD8|nr:cholesterol oxidase substrate-binding domain-containing protein [Erwinia phyllosphaerae]